MAIILAVLESIVVSVLCVVDRVLRQLFCALSSSFPTLTLSSEAIILSSFAFHCCLSTFSLSTVIDGLIRTRHVRLLLSHPITTPYLYLCFPVRKTIPLIPVTITSPLYLPSLTLTIEPFFVLDSSLLFGFPSLCMGGRPKWTSSSSCLTLTSSSSSLSDPR